MTTARAMSGGAPCSVQFGNDSLDSAFAPGTGPVEPGNPTPCHALEIIRGASGLTIGGGDVVAVSARDDPSGNTALIGANLIQAILCMRPGVRWAQDLPSIIFRR